MKRKLEIYKRADNKWAWRLVASNGRIIATDGGQGYENYQDCEDMVKSIFNTPLRLRRARRPWRRS